VAWGWASSFLAWSVALLALCPLPGYVGFLVPVPTKSPPRGGMGRYCFFPLCLKDCGSDQHCKVSCFYLCFYRGFSGGQKTEEAKQDKDDIINIFSVASGHLYERFLRLDCFHICKLICCRILISRKGLVRFCPLYLSVFGALWGYELLVTCNPVCFVLLGSMKLS
jgi:hypothetical protein